MFKKILCLLSIYVACFAYAKEQDTTHKVIVTDFGVTRSEGGDILFNFPSKYLPYKLKITVFLPAGYSKRKSKYPAIYLAENKCFFDEGLDKVGLSRLFETSNRLISEKKIRDTIIIDIELLGNCGHKKDMQGYAKFLALELIPYIDLNYRTLAYPEGRLVIDRSFYVISKIPKSFGMSAVLDPVTIYLGENNVGKLDCKLWFGAGGAIHTDEGKLTNYARKVTEIDWLLKNHSFEFEKDFVSFLEGFGENKKDTAMESMLMYFFAKQPAKKITSFKSRIFPQIADKKTEIIFGAEITFDNGLKAHYLNSDAETAPSYLSHCQGVYYVIDGAKPAKVRLKAYYGKRKISAKMKIVDTPDNFD